MITSLRRMVTCHWSVRRTGRYLHDDPAAPLTAAAVKRLEDHLTICELCRGVTVEHRALHRALSQRSQTRLPDDALAQLPATLDRVAAEGPQ